MSGNRLKYVLLISISAFIIALDQFTKWMVRLNFQWGESVTVWNDIFALTYVRNTGAAFGFLHRAPSWFRDPFFIVVPIVALAVIAFLFSRIKPHEKLTAVALSLIVGGAVGNLIDRVRFGYVVDFLDFHWKEVYHWPAFNVADSAIVVGVSLMFLLSFKKDVCVSNVNPKA